LHRHHHPSGIQTIVEEHSISSRPTDTQSSPSVTGLRYLTDRTYGSKTFVKTNVGSFTPLVGFDRDPLRGVLI